MTDQKNDALMPCPFCGGEGEHYQPCEDIAVISCKTCNAESGYYMGNDSTTPDDAITFWNTRAQPVADDAGGDVQAWVKAEPHGTYEGMKLQFYSLKSMINSMGQQLSFYMNKSYETGEKHLSALQESLESERAMNAALTEELAALSSPQTPADLIDAARAVIARWDTPAWKESEPTAEVIDRLRMAVDAVPPPQPDPRAEAMGMMVEALESVWYSEFSNNETCMEGRQIKQALNHPAVKPFIKGRG